MEFKYIDLLNDRLKQEDMWFTTKNDPTFEEASHYYKLDEYGYLTDASAKNVDAEIEDFIGDGATTALEAIDLWIAEAQMDNRIAYTSMLVTKFKDRPVIDGIDAFENPVQLTENKLKEDFVNDNGIIIVDDKESGYTYAKILVDFFVNDKDSANAEVDKFLAKYKSELAGRKETVAGMLEYLENWNYHTYANILEDRLVDTVLTETKGVKTEDYKKRLEEENTKSANVISQMFQAKDFDSDSKAGKIVMRTSDLFNALSDKGYDVQVSFDNGESTSAILLGQQGGQVMVTITDDNTPLRAFASGNFEINKDNIDTLNDIGHDIQAI